MEHSKNDKNLSMCFAIHGQYMNELKNKSIPRDKKNKLYSMLGYIYIHF